MGIIADTNEYQIVRTAVPGGTTDQLVWKSTSAETNRDDLIAKAKQAVQANATSSRSRRRRTPRCSPRSNASPAKRRQSSS